MLPAEHRLRHRAEFAVAVQRGRRATGGSMVAHLFVPSAGSGPPRVGFIVPRAVGNAVVRNRVRRRLRQLSRNRLPQLPPASLLVLRVTTASAGRAGADLGSDLDRALARVTR